MAMSETVAWKLNTGERIGPRHADPNLHDTTDFETELLLVCSSAFMTDIKKYITDNKSEEKVKIIYLTDMLRITFDFWWLTELPYWF